MSFFSFLFFFSRTFHGKIKFALRLNSVKILHFNSKPFSPRAIFRSYIRAFFVTVYFINPGTVHEILFYLIILTLKVVTLFKSSNPTF